MKALNFAVLVFVGAMLLGALLIGAWRTNDGSCRSRFNADRCQALALAAADQLGVPFDQILEVDVVADPRQESGPDFAHRIFLEVALATGSKETVGISCGGLAPIGDPPCMEHPRVGLAYPGGVQGGTGDYTDGGFAPFPSLEPAAVAGARPLIIASLPIAVAGRGPQTFALGRAILPNGYLTLGKFAMADPWPSGVVFDGAIQLVLTPTTGGPPLRNLYEHGWHEGTEEVEATLSFDVAWFEPGATFTIVDVAVR